MGTVLGIAGFTLLWAATCLTEASLAEIVLTGLLGLALMIAGRLWTPCMGWIKERMRRQPMPAGTRARLRRAGRAPTRVGRQRPGPAPLREAIRAFAARAMQAATARGVTGEADMHQLIPAGSRVNNAGSAPEPRRDVLPAGPRRAHRRCAGGEGTPCGSGKRANRPA